MSDKDNEAPDRVTLTPFADGFICDAPSPSVASCKEAGVPIIYARIDPPTGKVGGVEIIRAERERQLVKKGYDEAHDDDHSEGELCLAAVCYAAPDRAYIMTRHDNEGVTFEDPWPWDQDEDARRRGNDEVLSNSLTHQNLEDRIRQLAKAGALIAAEIDRLERIK